MPFRALRVVETAAGKFERSIEQLDLEDLPPGELLVRVQYSSLNYKDALSASGNKGITKKFPHTPGIDAAGFVELSRSPRFAVNEEVIVMGHDLGMNTPGGFAEYIRVPAQWAIKKPLDISLQDAMAYGTAGFTAAYAVYKLEQMKMLPSKGSVVVTGSTGGVGSFAVAILAKAGYDVIAITGKENAKEYLEYLGAKRIENREFVNDTSGKALLKSQWAAAIDTVGGNTLNTLLKGCMLDGSVVSTGLVGSHELNTTVFPFILNGVNLLGIGTAETDSETRMLLWQKLANEWNVRDKMNAIIKEVTLEELNNIYIDAILRSKVMGRIVVKI